MTDDQDRRPGHPPGQGLDLPLRATGRLAQGDHPFLDRMNLKTLQEGAPVPVPGPRTTSPSSASTATARTKIIISHGIQDRRPQLLPLRPQDQEEAALTEFKDPAPQLTGGQEGAHQVQAGRRRRALGDALPPGRLQGRAPASPSSSGPIRWNTATPRRPARSAARSTGSPSTGGRPSSSSSPRATPSSTTPRCPSSATRRR